MLWLWGLIGAFIYAGPRLVRCWVTCRESGLPRIDCFFDFAVSCAVGAAAAEAFTRVALTYVGIEDQNAVGAVIGVFVNPVTPTLTKMAPEIVGNLAGVLKGLKGDAK